MIKIGVLGYGYWGPSLVRNFIVQLRINYRAGDMWAPHLDSTEALKLEVQEFVSAIQGGHQPLTDGQAGLKVVRVLETATASMALRGQVLEIPTGALA